MKTWFVTGATRGLGLETARAALAAGDQVVATGRDLPRLREALVGHDDRLLSLALDVTDQADVERAVESAAARFGRIDVLVNNAGYGQLGAFEETSAEAIERQFETNVFGVFRVTRAVLPPMRRQRSGHIITISSMVGLVGVDGGSVYCASKFAVAGWSEALSLELARFGIRATSVHPGYFRTDFLDRSSMRLADLSIDDYRETTERSTRRRDSVNRRQAGDPAAFGRAMVKLANAEEPPVRLAAGSDAVQVMADKGTSLLESAKAWRDLSTSTDFAEGA
ncbi:oxidoreductase [Mesorhizobium sp. L-8-3]|uniref:oxidoreductase n=1 Tax=Mesorhizobium sp. L-8-3 TaxID=2744522 RepID=UPI0019263CDA|nr:oxidoreductase [Mesorhizobium sp. L-8-3]BCH23473.1 short-chain dehydrogenase/reductase [Mesorhizobium sp. L-8-3]